MYKWNVFQLALTLHTRDFNPSHFLWNTIKKSLFVLNIRFQISFLSIFMLVHTQPHQVSFHISPVRISELGINSVSTNTLDSYSWLKESNSVSQCHYQNLKLVKQVNSLFFQTESDFLDYIKYTGTFVSVFPSTCVLCTAEF